MARTTKSTAQTESMGPHIDLFSDATKLAKVQLANSLISGRLSSYDASDTVLMAESEFISFHKPTELLVSRHFPGYRVFAQNGATADEAVGILLANSLDSESALESFRFVLSSPSIATSVIDKILPRPAVPVRRGKYLFSETMVIKATSSVLSGTVKDPNVIHAFAHVITRVLSHMGLVLPGAETKLWRFDMNYALSMQDIKRVILVESLRDIFSEARIAAEARRLDADATPGIIGEVIGSMLRHASHSIPEIRLRLEQLDIVQSLIHSYYKEPTALTNTMRASTSLATLASYTNFLAEAVVNKTPTQQSHSNSDMREACAQVLTIIQSAPSLEAISLSKYADSFGFVPCSASDGIYRGLVTYFPLGQSSSLDVVNAFKVDGANTISLIPAEYVPSASIASEINKTLLDPAAIHGLANLVADEISMAKHSLQDKPVLKSIGLTDADVVYLAIAKAEAVAIVRSDDTTRPISLVYAAKVGEYWRTFLGASTPSISYFGDAQSLLIFQSGATEQLPTSIAARSQTIELSSSYDTNYVGDFGRIAHADLSKPMTIEIELQNPHEESGVTTLKLRVSPLELLVGPDPEINRGGAIYAAICEPGVDRDIRLILSLVAAYGSAGPQVISDKAKSWMVEVLTPLATHPAVTRVAVKALNMAIIRAKLDARKLAPQYKEAVINAYFGCMLALLVRFGKVGEELVPILMSNLPVSALSTRAALSLASMPMPIDASQLID